MFNRLGNLQVFLDATTKFLHSDSMFSAVLWKDLEGVKNKSISASVKRYSNYTRKEMVDFSSEIDLHFLIAVLNSKYGSVLLTNIRAGDYHIYPEHIRNLPIPKISEKQQKPFITLVDKIIKDKQQGLNTTPLEQQIDNMVYKLYELTFDEVKMLHPDFWMTKEEYENFEIK
jgi:adenine-specific DNA-methyltransferase